MAPSNSQKPLFLATHPRSCSTAFERVFMTDAANLNCIHEPFGDAFYYGPERLSSRYATSEKDREASGFSKSTYKTVLASIDAATQNAEGKRVFIKDMASYLVPPDDHETYNKAQLAPSLVQYSSEIGTKDGERRNEEGGVNPTVFPLELLEKFHFAMLIRNPRRAIPSYYRCCVPPLSETTGFEYFLPNESGYRELRELFDFLRREGVVTGTTSKKEQQQNGDTNSNGYSNGTNGHGGPSGGEYANGGSENGDGESTGHSVTEKKSYEICVIDADDLLDHPREVVEKFCEMTGLPFDEKMLEWGANEGCGSFDKWKGFHEDAIGSSGLKARTQKKTKTREQELQEWREKYGDKGAEVIDRTADENMADYEYLKQFKISI